MTQRIRLFGYPVKKSLAPSVQNGLWQLRGLDFEYTLLESTNTTEALEQLQKNEVAGLAVTMPHKVHFMTQVDELSEEGKLIGSINTVYKRVREGQVKTIGTNTDWIGVRDAILAHSPELDKHTNGKCGMVVGAGGAGRAAIYALWKGFNLKHIYVVNRLDSETIEVANHFNRLDKGLTVHVVKTVEDAQKLPNPTVAVSTIPDIQPKTIQEKNVFAVSEYFLNTAAQDGIKCFVDMCYLPSVDTAMSRIALAAGWNYVLGTEVMIFQGIAQQNYWAQIESQPNEQVLDRARKIIQHKIEHVSKL